MDLQNLTLFRMANQKMDWLAQRQAVLAQNVANTDTPQYMPKDVMPLDFAKELGKATQASLMITNEKHIDSTKTASVSAVTTNDKHLSGTLSNQGTNKIYEVRKPYEVKIDKNGVVLEEQMAKIGKNQQDYEVTATIYSKYTTFIKGALSKGK